MVACMDWTLIYRDDSNGGRELRSPHKSRDDALLQANSLRTCFTIIRIEGPGVTLNAATIAKALATGKYAPHGMAIPKP